MASPPLVSVITATYNRANALRYSIESVVAQTLTDWEMWVVGDACTDETEETVREFDDSRIHFVNLPRNIGDQSGPNNEGFRRSSGKLIAYLNHDDLWFPDHLATCVQSLQETGADLVWPLVVKRRPDGVFVCNDLTHQRRYEPHLMVPASFWVMRRELAEEIGPWRHYSECHAAPSQEWLYRAYCARKDLRYISRCTAIALQSGGRPGAYANREFLENAAVYDQMWRNPDFRETILVGIAEHYSIQQTSPPVWQSVKNTWRDLVRRRLASYWGWPKGNYDPPIWLAVRKRLWRLVGAAGLHPMKLEFFLKYRRKGGFIRYLRQVRGLPADASPEERALRAPGAAGRK